MELDDIHEVRRRNLRQLVIQYEGMNSLARRLRLGRGAYISQLLMKKPVRTISEKTARKWERELNLPEGWMDRPVGSAPKAAGIPQTALLSEVVSTVQETLKSARVDLSPGQLGELIALNYKDAVAAGAVDRERIKAFVSVLRK